MITLHCPDRLRWIALRLRHPLWRETPEAARFRVGLELQELGYAAYRQRMRRENPQATKKELDAMVWAWRREPPREHFLRRPPGKDDDDTR